MKFGEWIVVLIGMAMFLSFMGIPTGISTVLNDYGVIINNSTLQSADIGNSSLFNSIFGSSAGILVVLLASGIGSVIVGLFAKSYDTSLIILPLIITTAGLFIGVFWSTILYVYNFGEAWVTAIVGTIFVALGVAFIWSAVDYYANR